MATIDELKKRYREMFPVVAGAKKTGELDIQYQKLFGPEKEAPSIVTEKKPREFFLERYEEPEIAEREEEPLWRKAARWVLPKKAEEFLGLDVPVGEKLNILEKTIGVKAYRWLTKVPMDEEYKKYLLEKEGPEALKEAIATEKREKIEAERKEKEAMTMTERWQEQETARQVYYREKDFMEVLNREIKENPELPEDYKEPTSFFGQLIEGVEAGWKGTIIPSVGYFSESMGIKIGSQKMIKWGQKYGDEMMVEFLKQPELVRPENLKGLFDGGLLDPRYYGRTIGEVFPFMATVIGISIASGFVFGPQIGIATAFGSVAVIEQGNAYKAMLDAKVAPDKAAEASVIYGAVAAVIENLVGFAPGKMAAKILNPSRIFSKGIKSYLLKDLPKMAISAAKKSIAEGGEEVAQQFAEDIAAEWAGSEEGRATFKELANQFAAGLIGSIPFGVTEFRLPSFKDVGITKPVTPTDVKPEIRPPVVPEEKIDISEMKEADAVVVSADKFKEKFNDFDPANHEKYSAMSMQLYAKSLKEVVNPVVKFTAGGAGSGKSEFVVSQLAKDFKFDGIIYDTVLENYDAFIEKVNLAKEAGKQVDVFAILPRIASAWKFVQKRAIITGRFVPLNQFIKGHIGFVETLKKIIEENPEINVAIKDTRNIFKKKEARNAEFIYDTPKVVDTLLDTEYNESKLLNELQYVYLSTKAQRKALAKRERIRREAALPARDKEVERAVPEKPEAVGRLVGRERAVGRIKERIKRSYQFFSPNIEENLTFEEARKRLTSEDQATLKSISEGIDKDLGIRGETIDVLGDWSDGAENSIMVSYEEEVDWETNKYSVSQKGLVSNQKAVILFKEQEGGKDTLYAIEIPEILTMGELRKALDELGLQFRTIVSKNEIFIFDPGSELTENIDNLKKKYGKAIIGPKKGKGEFLGGETRAEGTKIFREVIRTYEEQLRKQLSEREVISDIGAKKPEVVKKIPEEKPKAPAEGEVLFVAPKEKVAKKKLTAKEEFKVGDVIEVTGNMVSPATIRKIEGNSLYFTDAEGTDYFGTARSTVRNLIKEGVWKRVEVVPKEVTPTAKIPPPVGVVSATVGKFRDGTKVEMGQMDKVRPIEFPELVELARELSGDVPTVTKRFRVSLGKFYAIERGRIKLDANLFKKENEGQLVATLAHEIGHLVDYLPHQTLKRGNLLGSLLSLRFHLKDTFGAVEITNEEIRNELSKVSEFWRPYDLATASTSFVNYRNSARELYADAVSVLFNTPGTLERLAPKFYKGFFEAMDAKPEFKKAYFDIQEILSHDRATLVKIRRERTREMFDRADYKSEELQKVREEERQLKLKDFWNRFTYTIKSLNQPIYNKVKEAEARGEHIPDDENPKFLLSARNYLAGQIKAEFETNVVPIMKDLEKNGIDWKTFGEFLLYERISEGDRSEFANPGGITLKDAKERISALKIYHGKNFSALESNAAKFRKFLKSVGEEAYKEGLFATEMFDLIKGNEKYVPFQVVEYMEQYVSWKSKPQIGTLKDVNNPANSLILKAISTIRAIESQKNKMTTFKFLEKHFADEIQEAELQFTGRAQRPIESRDPKIGTILYYKEGKVRGKYVDKYIAKALEKDSIARNRAVMTILSPISFLNQKLFRPLFVIYNPGWIPFNFIRDYMRFWKNTPDLTMLGAIKRYGQAFRAARVRAFGEKKDSAADAKARELIRSLEKQKLLSVTWNDMLSGQTTEDAQIEAVMQKIGLAESKKEIPAIYKPFEMIFRKMQIIPLLRGIRKLGDLIETLPKVAGYYELQSKMPPEQMRDFIRKNIGSPDFFEKGFLTPATNNIFLFSNAFIQAVTADAWIATNPTTRSGFWFKTAKTIFVPKILMFAALAGAFGDDLKRLYEDASEYDMTNYFVIPLGRDKNNGKTIYLRIPMDETSRLLGGVLWKIMRGSSNEQKFGRDLADLASLFGGQLPSLTPSIQAPVSVMQFISGQNPYDSFRGRMVLTKAQMEAGGMYALKPFLLWQFQQMGGNIFVKFYAGEQTPREKSPGEKFLQIPILSNILGRFVKISDYGQLEKYRAKLETIKGEKAKERIDENKLVNEYVKKYQDKEGDLLELGNDLVLDVLGHAISSREERRRADNIKKKLRISVKRGEADPKINALISAQTNEEKATLMRVYQELMSEEDYDKLKKELLQFKIISTNVLRELNKPFQK